MRPYERLFSNERMTRETTDGDMLRGEVTTFFVEDFKGMDGNACALIEIIRAKGTNTRAIKYQLGRHRSGWNLKPDTFEPINPEMMNQEEADKFNLELLSIADRLVIVLETEGAKPDFSRGFKPSEIYLITEVSA